MVIFIVMSTVCFCPFVGEKRRALRGEEPASMRETPESSVSLTFASTASLHDGRRKAAKAVSESAMWKFFILVLWKDFVEFEFRSLTEWQASEDVARRGRDAEAARRSALGCGLMEMDMRGVG
jgi:hypothetical protein